VTLPGHSIEHHRAGVRLSRSENASEAVASEESSLLGRDGELTDGDLELAEFALGHTTDRLAVDFDVEGITAALAAFPSVVPYA
jgi:hypothetical protein